MSTAPIAPITVPTPAGAVWCKQFPTSRTTATLARPWRRDVQQFIYAIEAAGGGVTINCTARPYARAWCMHWAWMIAREHYHAVIPEYDGLEGAAAVPIVWTVEGAREMVHVYDLAYRPALTSEHIPRRHDGDDEDDPTPRAHAIDMEIEFEARTHVLTQSGIAIAVEAGNGNLSVPLMAVGASYGVHKLIGDEPHWSVNGR